MKSSSILSQENRESFKSRVEDIRRDSSTIYVQLFELIENAFEWGKATKLTIKVREGKITLTDNGPNGFGSLDALKRYFKLGERNDDFTEYTIGKYGKGGYKACITLSSELVIQTTINDERYQVTADFNTMIDKNSWETSSIEKIEGSDVGTCISLRTRKVYEGQIEKDQFRRNIIRTYYRKFKGNTIELDLSESNKDTIVIGEEIPIKEEDIWKQETYKIVYNKKDCKYYIKEDNYHVKEDEIDIGTIKCIVLKSLLKKKKYLGNKPGIDIFRNDRCLTTENPIDSIRDKYGKDVKDKLGSGQMRGMKCHIEFSYKDMKINEDRMVDDDMAASTQKEFTCSDKMHPELIDIILKKSDDTSNMYEELVESDKKEVLKYKAKVEKDINQNGSRFSTREDFKQYLENLQEELLGFKTTQLWYREGNDYKFCKSDKDKSDGMVKVRTNSNIYKAFTDESFMKKIKDTLEKLKIELEIELEKNKLTKFRNQLDKWLKNARENLLKKAACDASKVANRAADEIRNIITETQITIASKVERFANQAFENAISKADRYNQPIGKKESGSLSNKPSDERMQKDTSDDEDKDSIGGGGVTLTEINIESSDEEVEIDEEDENEEVESSDEDERDEEVENEEVEIDEVERDEEDENEEDENEEVETNEGDENDEEVENTHKQQMSDYVRFIITHQEILTDEQKKQLRSII